MESHYIMVNNDWGSYFSLVCYGWGSYYFGRVNIHCYSGKQVGGSDRKKLVTAGTGTKPE